TLMDPDLTNGTRKKLTALDAAALQDIGWSLPPLNGDYNNNYLVDAADYVMYRKNLNRSVTLPNDTTPGTVTLADYTVWRTNFGKNTVVAGSLSGDLLPDIAVPETSTGVLMVMAGLVGCSARRRPQLSADR